MTFGRAAMPQTCAICKTDEHVRERWGCDVETPEPQFFIPCPRCLGQDGACERCCGSGREAVRRCPFTCLDPVAVDVVSAVSMLEQGILPGPGAWCQQAAVFVEAMPFVLAGRVFVEAEAKRRGDG